jgi:hypothetical protein
VSGALSTALEKPKERLIRRSARMRKLFFHVRISLAICSFAYLFLKF